MLTYRPHPAVSGADTVSVVRSVTGFRALYSVLLALTQLFSLIGAAAALDEGDDEPDEPPVVGRPEHFNGAIGSFQATAQASKTELEAEDPLTYTVRITAISLKRAPQRPKLANFKGFSERFYIEDIPPAANYKPDGRHWEFLYRLRPRNVRVQAIPSLPFTFYKPGIVVGPRSYHTIRLPEIPLRVKPRAEVQTPDIQGPTSSPDIPSRIYRVTEGPRVLRRHVVRLLPSPEWLVLLLTLPLGVGFGWYFLWRLRHPDLARLARRRRTRAAREALRALHRYEKSPRAAETGAIVAIVAQYLHQRLDLHAAEPTPDEVASRLRQQGIAVPLAERASGFFRTWDAYRFDPTAAVTATALANEATQLIHDLEGDPCLTSSS